MTTHDARTRSWRSGLRGSTPTTLERLRAASPAPAAGRACSTSPTARSTRPSARCCWRQPPTGLVRVAFAIEDHDDVLQSLADRISPRLLHAPARLDDAPASSTSTSPDRRHRFDVPLDLRLSTRLPPHRAAAPPRRSPTAHTASYAAVARSAGNPKAVRAVGTACATNPLPVVVPCHRVVRSDGSIGGYLGGSDGQAHAARAGGGGVSGSPRSMVAAVSKPRLARIGAELDAFGCAAARRRCSPRRVRRRSPPSTTTTGRFRSTIDMARHRFGEGEYRYFADPLPEPVAALRQAL